MRASLVLEPAVLAMPALSKDESGIARSIEIVVQLSEALREDEFGIYLLQEAENYLAEANLYPVSDSISQSLTASGLSHVYATEDVRRSIQNILQRASHLEALSEIEFLIPNSMKTNPDASSELRPAPLKEAFEITLAHAGFATERAGTSNVRMILAESCSLDEIEVHADISEITPPLGGQSASVDLSCVLGLSSSVSSFSEQLDGDELWRIAETATEIATAIAVKARFLRKSSGCPAPRRNCETFAVGSYFFNTMCACQANPLGKYGRTTFDSLARLVARAPTEAPRKLYKLSQTGDREDVVRADGSIGWRLHITKSGEAIRLMFWRRKDASIEFANVGPKGDVKIH